MCVPNSYGFIEKTGKKEDYQTCEDNTGYSYTKTPHGVLSR